jgi:hypothetical protein
MHESLFLGRWFDRYFNLLLTGPWAFVGLGNHLWRNLVALIGGVFWRRSLLMEAVNHLFTLRQISIFGERIFTNKFQVLGLLLQLLFNNGFWRRAEHRQLLEWELKLERCRVCDEQVALVAQGLSLFALVLNKARTIGMFVELEVSEVKGVAVSWSKSTHFY